MDHHPLRERKKPEQTTEEQETMMARTSTESSSKNPNGNGDTRGFLPLFAVANTFALLAIIMVITWCSKYLGGYSWSDPNTRFNWHPTLMTIGFVFFYGNGMLVYRLLRRQPKPQLKLIHAGINGTAFLLAIIAQIAVFSFHNDLNIPNLYTIHSWIGLLTMIFFGGNLVGGTFAFLLPQTPGHLRALILPFHVFGGNIILGLIAICFISGITEKALFSLKKPGMEYRDLPLQAVVLNFFGLFVVLFAIIAGFIVTRQEYKRRPLPSEVTTSHVPMEETTH